MSIPQDLCYTKDHEWIKVAGDRGTVGITDHAQSQLGDVVFVDLPEPGRSLRAGEVFGSVESVKAVSELFSPVAGQVLEVNVALAKRPEAVNTDPHGAGWMIVLRLADAGELTGLMDAGAYEGHVASESKS